jgi:glycerol uptake facilitator-like aquaporin
MKNLRSYCAEFIGTFFLVLTVCVAGILGYAGPYAPIAIGAVLMVMGGFGFFPFLFAGSFSLPDDNSIELFKKGPLEP